MVFHFGGIVLAPCWRRCKNVSFLSWLSYYQSIGFNADAPFVLDLSVIKLSFGFSMGISAAQIFTIAAAIFLYNKDQFAL